MIDELKAVVLTGIRQLKNARRIVQREKILVPSMVGMTLEKDDADLAKQLLGQPESWLDESVISEFHDEFSKWNGSKHVFTLMGGRVALSACLAGLGLQPGDEVILPAYTCVVVPNAIKYAGFKPVFADIELETYGLSLEDVKRKSTSKTKAVLIQHLFGLVCKEIQQLLNWAKENDIFVIEDCAHSTGATYKGTKVGNLGDVGFYSCEQSKVMNTMQGGIAVTNRDDIAARMKAYYDSTSFPSTESIDLQLRTHVFNYLVSKDPWRWLMVDWKTRKLRKERAVSTTKGEIRGEQPDEYHCKMPAAIARLGLKQLAKIDRFNALRKTNARTWDRWCEENEVEKAVVIPDSDPIFLRYPAMVEASKKQDKTWALKELGVNPGVWFVTQVHPAEQFIPDCPNSMIAVERCINFPSILS